MSKIWIHDGKIVERPAQAADTINPTDEQLSAHGYACVEAPDCDRKYWIIGDGTITEMSQAEKDAVHAAEAAAAQAAAEQSAIAQAEYLAGVDVYPRAIEAPVVIVHSTSAAKGIGITATDDGELVPYVAHESPYDHEAATTRRMAAVSKKNDAKTKGKAGVNGQLQQRIENIERFLGWRE